MASNTQNTHTGIREAVAASDVPAQHVSVEENQQDQRYLLRSHASRYAEVNSDTSSDSNSLSEWDVKTFQPPRFEIDLSLPPEQRYLEVCAAFKRQMKGLTPLFDEIVGDFLHWLPVKRVHQLARLFLRRVYDKEESRELKGISMATGVEMHLLVSFNVLLDLLMGCSSGGVVVRDGEGGTKMVHFRTLDWGMPSLRKILVQLDFKTQQDGAIISSSVTYAGYVGVLTGVRPGFSVSLNFRPNRHNGNILEDAKYYYHLTMVLLGRRRSISSQLRCFLLPQKLPNNQLQNDLGKQKYWTYTDAISCMCGLTGEPLMTTVCYLCFSDGDETTVIEKDRATAVIRSSDEFIAVTNYDDGIDESSLPAPKSGDWQISLADVVSEAKDRRECIETNYYGLRKLLAEARKKAGFGSDLKKAMGVEDVKTLLLWYPTTNEMTHFGCVMDPRDGTVSVRRFIKPISQEWIRRSRGFAKSKFT